MPEVPAVNVTVKLRFGEAFRASARIVLRRFLFLLVIFSVIAMLTTALFIFASLNPRPRSDWYETARNPIALYWAVGLPLVIFVGLPLLSARQFVTNDRMKCGFRYEFSEAGVHIEGPVSSADLKWVAIIRVLEQRWCFLLFPNKNVAHTIPKRCFANPDDTSKLRELLKLHVPDARLLAS